MSPSTGDKTITVTVKASDPSGVSTPTISASSNETDQSAGFGGMDLAAGTATNGTWKRTITFPATAAPGTWTIDLFPLKDSLGNGVGGFRTIATITVTAKAPTDTTGPIFISGSVDKTTVSPSTGDKTITVTIKASDPSGVSTPTISASSNETDQSAGFGGMDLAAGTATNGTWKRTITFPATAAPGTWTIDLFPLKDSLGNGVGGFRTIATITVTAKAPTISAGSVKVTGTAKVGAILTAAPSSWPAGTTFRYSWSADGTVIAGENAKTFVPTAGVVGKKITVRVTGSLAGYSSSSKTSAATNPVTKATLTSAPPTVSGAAKVGSTLTVKAGTWTSGAALRYQWFAGAQPIAGATSATFVPKAAHVGSRLSVRVTGTLQGYVNKVETSAPTRPVTR